MSDREVTWEYRTVPLNPRDMVERGQKPEDRLNELGDEGWELAATAPMGQGPGSTVTLLILKRRVDE